MHRAAGVVAVLATAVVATADVQIFVTPDVNPWVAPGPANVFMPTAGNGTDWSVDGYQANFANFPTAFQSSTSVLVGQKAYIWVKFNTDTQNGPVQGAKLQGLDLNLANAGAGSRVAWYVMDDKNGAQGIKRWDGAYTPPNYPEFTNFHQVLVAITAGGIKNTAFDQQIGLYKGASRIALLGVASFQTPGQYTFGLGSQGINFDTGPSAPPVQFGTLTVGIPEPAAFGLLAVAAGLLRRRG